MISAASVSIIDENLPHPGELNQSELEVRAAQMGMSLEEFCDHCASVQMVRDEVASQFLGRNEYPKDTIDMSNLLLTFNRHHVIANVMEWVDADAGAIKFDIDWSNLGESRESVIKNIPKLINELEADKNFKIPLIFIIRGTAKERFVDMVECGLNELITSGKIRWEKNKT